MPGHPARNTKLALLMLILTLALLPGQAYPYNWLQFNGDPQHSANNTLEKAITRENVGNLRKLFTVRLPATVDGAPVYLGGVKTPKGSRPSFCNHKSRSYHCPRRKERSLGMATAEPAREMPDQ